MARRALVTSLAPALLALLLTAGNVGAQVVQGRVTDDLGASVATALVTLEDEGGVTVRAVLSTAAGDYSIPAGRPGRFRIRVERLGLSPFTTPSFELLVGETRVLPITVPPAPVVLAEIAVAGASRCEVRQEDAEMIARLRDGAGRALREAPPLDPEAVFPELTAVRYRRELDRSGEKQTELIERNDYSLGAFLPFTSRAENQLIWGGFTALSEEDRRFSYYAPPIEMIFSDPFLDLTCFTRIVEEEGNVGITFAPVEGMTVIGIGGTIWLDPATLRPRLLTYEYYDPVDEEPNGVSGEVELDSLPDGTPLLARWWIRIPSELELPPENVPNGRATSLALTEDGGILLRADGTPFGNGGEILLEMDPEPVEGEGRAAPERTALSRSLVMRAVPEESYTRAAPVILASLTSVTTLEMDLLYSTVPNLRELLRLRFPGVLEDGERLRSAPGCGAPLFVVDHVPTSAQLAWGLPGTTIARVEVHRHGAELALYGFQGSCGVIEVWTRRQ